MVRGVSGVDCAGVTAAPISGVGTLLAALPMDHVGMAKDTRARMARTAFMVRMGFSVFGAVVC